MTAALTEKAKQVKLLITDVDGVLTDGGLHFDNQGQEYKRFSSLDGHGIRMLLDSDIEVAVITGRQSGIVTHRMHELGVERVYQGYRNKIEAFDDIMEAIKLDPLHAAYVGDDLPDLPVMQRVGFSIAVQNAHSFVKQHCDWVTTALGGHGAIREISDFILHSQGLLDRRQQAYLE